MSAVHTLLTAPGDVREVARRLGATCLQHEDEIFRVRSRVPRTWEPMLHIDAVMAAVPEGTWLAIVSGDRHAGALWDAPGVADAIERLEAVPPLELHAVFRALCRHGLGRWFERTNDVVPLRYGDAFPSPARPLHRFRNDLTPAPSTTLTGHLLEGTGFRLWRHPDGARISAELDYSSRELLADATWQPSRDGGPLPVVATIHPYADWRELTYDRGDGAFFRVRPKSPDKRRILEQLAACDAADIALLPELSLDHPEALAADLAADPAAYPRIVVAGSAHATDAEGARRNVSVTYLDGVPVLHARKIHPMVYRPKGSPSLREDLTEDPAVIRCLCSETTRLAVVICADLNDEEIPLLLQQLGVNLLLVPTLTPHEGCFSGAVASLASYCQGVSVIVNGSPPPDGHARTRPFMVLAGAPSRRAGEQVVAYGPPPGGRRAVGRLDVNGPLRGADLWG